MALRALTLRRIVFRRFDDETLLAHVLDGQESAFSELHLRYRTIVYGYCLARLMDPSAAEDVTQDTFMRVHSARGSEPIRSARAWIFSVARSALVDHVRRQKRQPSFLSVEEELAVVSPGADASETAERREQAQSVFLAIARLRPRYRSALLLREMHGLSSVEIGEAMNLKPGAVDTLVSRARDAFGKEYANLGDLPATCRRAVEYMYRERGTGIDSDERQWLGDHVGGCSRCARERRTATDSRGLAMLLPLVAAREGGFGFLTRAAETLGWAPASVDALSSLAAKATVVVLAATIAVSPVAAPHGGSDSEVPGSHAGRVTRSVTAVPHDDVPATDVGGVTAAATATDVPAVPVATGAAAEGCGATETASPGATDDAVVCQGDQLADASEPLRPGDSEASQTTGPRESDDESSTGLGGRAPAGILADEDLSDSLGVTPDDVGSIDGGSEPVAPEQPAPGSDETTPAH